MFHCDECGAGIPENCTCNLSDRDLVIHDLRKSINELETKLAARRARLIELEGYP